MIFRRNKKVDLPKSEIDTEMIKGLCFNAGIVFERIRVNENSKQLIFIDYDKKLNVSARQVFNKQFYKKVYDIVQASLPVGFRCKPRQENFLNAHGDLVVEYESTESKSLKDIPKVENYKIQLSKIHSWQLTAPHALITGVSGSGKSMFINYLIACLVQIGAEMYLIDPKNADLASIAEATNTPLAVNADEVVNLLEKLVQIMDERQNLISKFGELGSSAYSENYRPIVLIFDEMAAVASFISADKKLNARYNTALKQLMLKGRSAGITVILSMQKPLSSNLPTEIRDQCSLRLVLGKNTPKDVRQLVFGKSQTVTVINDDTSLYDEWGTERISKYGGWIQLPNIADFDTFDSPDMTNFDFDKSIIQPLKKINSILAKVN